MKLAQNLQEINSNAGLGNNVQDVGDFAQNVMPYIYYGAAILLLVYMISGGFQLMFAAGDPKAIQSGWSRITNALIGFIVIIVAYFIVKIIGQIFGIEVFESLFGLAG